MRIVFFGTPDLAVPSLAAVAGGHDVTALVCRADAPQGRSKKLVAPPTKVWAEEHGIPVHQPVKLNDGTFEAWLKEQAPELCAIAAYGRILKQPILDVPPQGYLNVHPSLLPKYRGTAPLQGALLDGLSETGVTIMRIDAGMDTGDMLLRETLAIGADDTTGSLTEKAGRLGADLLMKGIELVERGEAVFTKQDDAEATYTKMLEKKDGRIDWAQPAIAIHNLVRAANPWPSAQCVLAGKPIRIHKSAVLDDSGGAPGEIIHVDKHALHVATGQGALSVVELQAAGKKAMTVSEFLNGARIQPGDRFEEVA